MALGIRKELRKGQGHSTQSSDRERGRERISCQHFRKNEAGRYSISIKYIMFLFHMRIIKKAMKGILLRIFC